MDKGTWIRTAVLVVALINQGLVMAGWDTLPWTDDDIQLFITGAFTVVAAGIAWWKDNAITKKAIHNEKFLKNKGMK